MLMCKDNKGFQVIPHASKGRAMMSNRSEWLKAGGCLMLALLLSVGLPARVLAQGQVVEDARVTENDDLGFKTLTGLAVQATDNLFASSSDRVSDVITTGTLGFTMKAAYGRQSLALNAALNSNQYLTHQDWNYIGNNFSGGWQWSSGLGLHGAVSASHVKSQNQSMVSAGSTQRNLNTTQTRQVSIGYLLDGGWDLNTGLVYSSSKNENAVLGQTSYQYNGVYVGATYNFRSGNALTLTTQRANGSNIYDYTIRSSELKFSTQKDEAMVVTWQLTHWNQRYELLPEYDFSVLGGGMQIYWPVTPRTSLALSAQRQPYGNPSPTSIYSTIDTLALTPGWEVSPKVMLRGVLQYGTVRDHGDPGGGASGRVDHIRMQTLGLYWTWQENATISGVVGRTERTSTAINSDFIINQITLQATYAF